MLVTARAAAGITVYDDGSRRLEIGTVIQPQGRYVDDDADDGETDVRFRRLRPYLEGSVLENWTGKVEVEFGGALDGDEVQVKDAFVVYTGLPDVTLTVGNSKTPFSREFLTSSKRQQLPERGFVGDHNFGAPDRQLGIRLDGRPSSPVSYSLALGAEQHDPDVTRLDFDTPANNRSDWNDGWVAAGRIDIAPWGEVGFAQGDFARGELRVGFGLAAFYWINDDDNNTYTGPDGTSLSASRADLDSAEGVELSTALRGQGISADFEYQRIEADTVVGSFTGGIYEDGSTDLDKLQLEGGYLLPGLPVEISGRWELIDADNYDDAWTAIEVGLNYFFNQHTAKAQVSLRRDAHVDGASDRDRNSLFLMFQYVL